jgi:hypothetical protein
MSKLNVSITKAYQIIRGDNLLTILVLPSIFDLDGFFTKRRARGLIHITAVRKIKYITPINNKTLKQSSLRIFKMVIKLFSPQIEAVKNWQE